MFRGKFLAGLEELPSQLESHGQLEPLKERVVWDLLLLQLRQQKWVVSGKGSVTGPEAVLEYLGRYTHRVALSNGRLLRMDERTVTFRYKDYTSGGALKEMTL